MKTALKSTLTLIAILTLILLQPTPAKAAIVQPFIGPIQDNEEFIQGLSSSSLTPTFTLLMTSAVGGVNSAVYVMQIMITAPEGLDIIVDASLTTANDPFYFDPGEGHRYKIADAPGSPARDAWLHSKTFKRLTPNLGLDVTGAFGIPGGQSSTFEYKMNLSLNPFEDPMPQRQIYTYMDYMNYGLVGGGDATIFAPVYFATEAANIGPTIIIPEPGTALLSMGGIGMLVGLRRNRKNRS